MADPIPISCGTLSVPQNPSVVSSDEKPTLSEVTLAVQRMILSASGWRAVFATDGNEQSPSTAVSPEFLVLTVIAAQVFADFLMETEQSEITVVVAEDTRPTGPLLSRATIKGLLSRNVNVQFLFVASSPEVMCYASEAPGVSGFFYISASHNPIGHNGFKMGGGSGVIGGDDSSRLIEQFRLAAGDAVRIAAAADLLAGEDQRESAVLNNIRKHKTEALRLYRDFSRQVATGPGSLGAAAFASLTTSLAQANPMVVADYNGSARAASIDEGLFNEIGVRLLGVNDVPGEIAHQIVPEGAGLQPCADVLTTASRDGAFLGYVPDNDGDRGNLVYWNTLRREARALEAQEVFALCVVAELAWLDATGALDAGAPVSVVVNGPTSTRVDRITAMFGASVHRAEVGEANVVGLASQLRDKGHLVRILGEGSNGGNITHPASVRDPIQTVLAILKLLYGKGENRPSPIEVWAQRSSTDIHQGSSLTEVIETLPVFATTSAFETRAIMTINSENHDQLKSRFETLLAAEFEAKKPWLAESLGVTGYSIVNYERTETRIGKGNRTGAGRGGLKVVLTDKTGVSPGFLWMRGSGTEPVFRVMADVVGDQPEMESRLLTWLREMVARADTR